VHVEGEPAASSARGEAIPDIEQAARILLSRRSESKGEVAETLTGQRDNQNMPPGKGEHYVKSFFR
jgi:hypothetical protein